jgi:hypothetical protein
VRKVPKKRHCFFNHNILDFVLFFTFNSWFYIMYSLMWPLRFNQLELSHAQSTCFKECQRKKIIKSDFYDFSNRELHGGKWPKKKKKVSCLNFIISWILWNWSSNFFRLISKKVTLRSYNYYYTFFFLVVWKDNFTTMLEITWFCQNNT